MSPNTSTDHNQTPSARSTDGLPLPILIMLVALAIIVGIAVGNVVAALVGL